MEKERQTPTLLVLLLLAALRLAEKRPVGVLSAAVCSIGDTAERDALVRILLMDLIVDAIVVICPCLEKGAGARSFLALR